MQYVLVIYETPGDFQARAAGRNEPYISAWRSYHQALVEAGVYVGGQPLAAVENAATVRVRQGKGHVQDGPYAETKEHLGGFIVLDVPSLEAALEWAARCPVAASGAVEVRPVASEVHETITT